MIKFLFDLDGTLTKTETLPFIAKHFNVTVPHVAVSMDKMTRDCMLGKIPFEQSFTMRVDMLKDLPINEISSLLEKIPVFTLLERFILENKKNCIIATSNLDCWIAKLCQRFGCESYTSNALHANNQVRKITQILQKAELVRKYQNLGYTVVFIGDGNNDIEAMKYANISIASGLFHSPSQELLNVSHYAFYEENALYQALKSLALEKYSFS